MKLEPINLLGILTTAMICPSNINGTGDKVFMRAITEQEELLIDKDRYGIRKANIFMYGEINLEDPGDRQSIKDTNLIDHNNKGMLYSYFDYDKGIAHTVNGQVKWAPCMDALQWFKFKHCLIGKPQRVVVFRY